MVRPSGGPLECIRQVIQGVLEKHLPVFDVDPFVELPAHFLEVRNSLEAKLLVQGDTHLIGEGNAP